MLTEVAMKDYKWHYIICSTLYSIDIAKLAKLIQIKLPYESKLYILK